MGLGILVGLAVWCFILAAWLLFRSDASKHAIWALVAEGLAILLWQTYRLAPAGNIEFAFKLDGLGLNAVIVMYCATAAVFIFRPPLKNDFLAQLLWAALLFIESYSLIVERFGCNLLGNDLPWSTLQESWAQDTAAGVCERLSSAAFVWVPLSFQIFISTIIAGAYLGWTPRLNRMFGKR